MKFIFFFPLAHNAFKNVSVVLTNTLFKFFGAEETIIQLIKSKDADKAKKAMEDLLNIGIEKLEKNYFNQ